MARELINVRQLLRFAGALALLGVGIDHIVEYYGDSYSVIPTIGTLFASTSLRRRSSPPACSLPCAG